jgi:GMP synthase PP-ATPase subunit
VLLQRARRHERRREERKMIGAQFLAQGTLHPDVIDTVSLTAAGRES